MNGHDHILISQIKANAKVSPHFTVLTGTSGTLIEDDKATFVFINHAGAQLTRHKISIAGPWPDISY